MNIAAALFAVQDVELEKALLSRHITSGSARVSTYQVPQNVEQVPYILYRSF